MDVRFAAAGLNLSADDVMSQVTPSAFGLKCSLRSSADDVLVG
jgi:hypothetical protein